MATEIGGVMKSYPSLLVAAALAATIGVAPALGQRPTQQRYQVAGKITKMNRTSHLMTIETKALLGHEGTTVSLPYTVSDVRAMASYHEGDHVRASVVVTNDAPRVVAIAPDTSANQGKII